MRDEIEDDAFGLEQDHGRPFHDGHFRHGRDALSFPGQQRIADSVGPHGGKDVRHDGQARHKGVLLGPDDGPHGISGRKEPLGRQVGAVLFQRKFHGAT